VSRESLEREHAELSRRLDLQSEGADALAVWQRLGVLDAARIPELDADAVRALRPGAAGMAA